MEFAIVPCWKIIFSQNWMDLTSAICGSNKMVPQVTQLVDFMNGKFGNRLISRNGPVEWPPRSCDLTPLDFFLWGYLKSKVYANNPTTLKELKNNIEREIANISADMCERVIENWIQRIDRCRRARGGHINDVEFHT